MTWIAKAAAGDVAELAKWRAQANMAATHLKGMKDFGGKTVFEPAFVFDDGIVKLKLEVALIVRLNEKMLADSIFEAVLTDHRAAGESADVQPSGMECGHAAPQGAGSSAGIAAEHAPAGAAVSQPCIRRIEPDFTENCPNNAAGGLRITLRPAEAVEKRWGMHSLLTFVMDLPVCADCFAKVKVMDVTDQDLRALLSRQAQKMNNGVLVDWKRTLIERVPFEAPEYKALRAGMGNKAANDSQPGQAAPQREGAGDGDGQDSNRKA